MKLTVNKQTTTEVEVHVPSFFASKDGKKFIGLLDENTVVSIYDNGSFKSVMNQDLNIGKRDIVTAINDGYHSCTEDHFIEKYDQVIESISLHPKLAV